MYQAIYYEYSNSLKSTGFMASLVTEDNFGTVGFLKLFSHSYFICNALVWTESTIHWQTAFSRSERRVLLKRILGIKDGSSSVCSKLNFLFSFFWLSGRQKENTKYLNG